MTEICRWVKSNRFDVNVQDVAHIELCDLGPHVPEETTDARVAAHSHFQVGDDLERGRDVLFEIGDAEALDNGGILVVLEVVDHQDGLESEDFHHLVENVNVLEKAIRPNVVVANVDGREEDTRPLGLTEPLRRGEERNCGGHDGLGLETRPGAYRGEGRGHSVWERGTEGLD